MPPRTRTVPRKAPHQERAKATVDAILTATAHVLVKWGYDRASTNRVAEEAGVSIGSLYQYFPSKEALVVALIDRHINGMLAVFEGTVAKVGDAPLPVAVRELVTAMMHAHTLEPKLHKILAEQIPRVGRLQKINDMQRYVATRLRPYLELRRREIKPKNLDMAVFILVELVEAVAHASMHDASQEFNVDELADEVTTVVLAYLTP